MLAVELDLRDFLRSRLPRLVPTLAFDQVIAYHGTRTDALQSIRDNGILAHPFKHYHPERFYKGVRGASVYLAANPAVAASWALSEVDDPAQVTILEVVVPAQGLHPDEEAPQAERYEGDIPPEWIHAVYPLLPNGMLGKPTALEHPSHASDAPMRRRYLVVRHSGAHGAQDREFHEEDVKRDPIGRFATQAGGGAAGLDPAVVKVGGDKWNQETAVRLERQYQSAKPEIDDLLTSILEGKSGVEAHLPAPQDWESLTGSTQAEAEDKWKKEEFDSTLKSEQDNWWETDSEPMARAEVVHNFEDESDWAGQGREWAKDAVEEWLADREADDDELPPVPYTLKQLTEALTLTLPDAEASIEVGFDNDKLQDPDINTQKEMLPGFAPEDLSHHLTKEMREGLTGRVANAMESEIDDAKKHLEPPDYLNETAEELVDDIWDQMSDGEKYEWAKENVEGIQEEEDEDDEDGVPSIKGEPDKWDPLNTTTGADYRKTQAIAKHLSIARAAQLIKQRHIVGWAGLPEGSRIAEKLLDDVAHLDAHFWSAWKASSTSAGGKMLQLATADELDGRLRNETINDIERKQLIGQADTNYPEVGGYAGLKAIVRAKWETTQFLLAKAGINEVQVYRGLSMYGVSSERRYDVKGYDRLPDVTLQRNGAASTTTDRDVADNWDGHDRLVLRIAAPRTAVLSVPAYGINVQSEHELVLAGTAWKAWDAWYRQAPPVEAVPIGAPLPKEAEAEARPSSTHADLDNLAAQAGLGKAEGLHALTQGYVTPTGGSIYYYKNDTWAWYGSNGEKAWSGQGKTSLMDKIKAEFSSEIAAAAPTGEVLIPPQGGMPVDQFHKIDDAMKAAGITLHEKTTGSFLDPGTVYKLPGGKGLLYIWHQPVGEEKAKWSFSISAGGESGSDLADLPAAIAAKAPTTAAGVAELQKQPY